jgi:hypothetical protein
MAVLLVVALNTAGWVMVTLWVTDAPKESVTVTL